MAGETGSTRGSKGGSKIKATSAAKARRSSMPDAKASATKAIKSISSIKKNSMMSINIGGETYHISSMPNGSKAQVLSATRSDGYSIFRETYTSSGSYGYARTSTKSEAIMSLQQELKRLIK